MKHYKGYRKYITIGFSAVLLLQSCASKSDGNITLPELLTNSNCASSCWEGIEPEVTNSDQLLEYLERNDIEYTTVSGPDVEYFDWFISDSLLSQNGEPIMVNIALYLPTDQVGYISFGQISLCVSTIVRDFGLPTAVIQSSDSGYTLAYPNERLVFTVDKELRKVYSFMIRDETVIEEEYVRTTVPPRPQDGSSIENLISEDCVDQFRGTE